MQLIGKLPSLLYKTSLINSLIQQHFSNYQMHCCSSFKGGCVLRKSLKAKGIETFSKNCVTTSKKRITNILYSFGSLITIEGRDSLSDDLTSFSTKVCFIFCSILAYKRKKKKIRYIGHFAKMRYTIHTILCTYFFNTKILPISNFQFLW